MKSKFTLALAFLIATLSFAQQGINYKAVIKDNLGNVAADQLLMMQFSILKGTAQTAIYTESHNPLSDANGIVIVNIGEGTPDSGAFTDINWGSDTHYLNVKVSTGGELVDMGTTQFMAVPYALYAQNVEGAVKRLDDLLDAKTSADSTSVFIGAEAGLNDLENETSNVGVGYHTLKSNTSGYFNVANGAEALTNNTTGDNNTANGAIALFYNTTGSYNTANGAYALSGNTTGSYNTANGKNALKTNTTGNGSTALGYEALKSNTTGSNNVANGFAALKENTTGSENTATGYEALTANTTGSYNTANGYQSLNLNTAGFKNTANVYQSLNLNTTGSNNTANGYNSLHYNTTGSANVASGESALRSNRTGKRNTANGYNSLYSNNTGDNHTANGYNALTSNTTGNNNTATGYQALYSNTTGSYNTATGLEAMYSNVVGFGNTANGYQALRANTEGEHNTAIGRDALSLNGKGDRNTAVGYGALKANTLGNGNTAIGYNAGSQIFALGSGNVTIGEDAQVPWNYGDVQVRIGSTQIGYAGVQVGWSIGSGRQYYSKIQNTNLGLAFINALKPVMYERTNDNLKRTEYGFVAQDVEATLKQFGATNNGLITIDDEGMYSLRYNDFISIAVKALQEQDEIIKSLQSTVGSQQLVIDTQNITNTKQSELIASLLKRVEALETLKLNQ